MKDSGSARISSMSQFSCRIHAEIISLAVNSDVSAPFTVLFPPRYALKAARVGRVGWSVVLIFTARCIAKIDYSIVIFNPVDVVNLSRRPIAIMKKPSNTMRFITLSKDA